MKIENKILDKFSRIKRIEYRLDKNEIEDGHLDFFSWVIFGGKYFIFFGFISIAMFYSNYISRIELSKSLIETGLAIFIVAIIFGIIDSILKKRKLSNLFNKYFEIKIKEGKNG